jgi:hypothetical protein
MKIKRQEIADASMCSLAKVNKDIQRGRLDEESAVSVACYIVMGRMSAGGLMGRMSAGGLVAITGYSPEPELHDVDKCPEYCKPEEYA